MDDNERIKSEINDLQRMKNQHTHERNERKDTARRYGNSHSTGQHAEKDVQEYDKKIEQLDRQISDLMRKL